MAWLGTWANRLVLTIDSSKVDATLTDFPVLIHLSSSSGITNEDVTVVFDELSSSSDRKKMAVTSSDGTTQLYVEIEQWEIDMDEEAWLHVKVPSISSSSDTTLYLYYDSAQADNTTYVGDSTDAVVNNVWDSDFVAVWHMAQDPDGDGADAIKDSTSNLIHLTPNGSMTTSDLVAGKAGRAIDFDGTGDDLETDGNESDLNLGSDDFEFNFTINFNNFPTNGGEADQIFNFANPTPDRRSYLLDMAQVASVLYFRFQAFNGTGTPTIFAQRTVSLSTGTWYNFSIRRDGTNVHIYQDGTELSTATAIGSPTIYNNTDDPFFIGSYHGTWSLGDFIIDEFRVTIGDARSAPHQKATYNSLWDSLMSFAASGADAAVASEPLEGTFTLNASVSALEGISLETLEGAFALSGVVALTPIYPFESSLSLMNSLYIGSTVSIINSLNIQVTSNIDIVLDVLQKFEATFGVKLTIEELVKFNATINFVNHIVDADSGITQGQYYFLKSHGL
jgi:hypothetical protein